MEVSNDGSSFTQVSAFNEEHFDVLYERKCYVLPAVTAPMRAMRFHFTAIVDAASSNLQINAIDLYMIDARAAGPRGDALRRFHRRHLEHGREDSAAART